MNAIDSSINANKTPLIGFAKLMRMAFSGVDLAPLGTQLIEEVHAGASANSLMDLAIVLQIRGNRDLGLRSQSEAIAHQQVYTQPTTHAAITLRVCAVLSAGDFMANTPIEILLEDSDVLLHLVYVTEDRPLPAAEELPKHDVLFVAIAQSDQNMALLQAVNAAIACWPCPVLNLPERIALLSRNQASVSLQDSPGISMPNTARIDRLVLEKIADQTLALEQCLDSGVYPIIVRPVDSHAGHGLDKIDDALALEQYLQTHANSEFYISRFIDYRGQDGLFRKYRIVLIEGRPFICHLAISENWMIHYLNAGMAESAEKRAEEATVMATFDTDFATRHAQAFSVINECMGLNYLGIDCGETADGQLLIFEVDSCMMVHALDSVELFAYKQVPMNKLFNAFRDMLLNIKNKTAISHEN